MGVFEGTIYTAGEDSFLASLIETAGGDPITGDAVTTAIPLEDLVTADPELILLGDVIYDPTITPETVAARDGWAEMTAVVDGRIVMPLPEDLLITRPGPRIVDGLEALARAIHPERSTDARRHRPRGNPPALDRRHADPDGVVLGGGGLLLVTWWWAVAMGSPDRASATRPRSWRIGCWGCRSPRRGRPAPRRSSWTSGCPGC